VAGHRALNPGPGLQGAAAAAHLRFVGASFIMDFVKFLLAVALAVHLSGVPAVVALPCASGSEAASDCCTKHQADVGGAVITSCGCHAPSGGADAPTTASVAPASSEHAAAPALLALPSSIDSAMSLSAARTDESPVPLDTSPPHLSGTGFRC